MRCSRAGLRVKRHWCNSTTTNALSILQVPATQPEWNSSSSIVLGELVRSTGSEPADEISVDILNAGTDLSVLDEDRNQNTIGFYHQLLQEYFAARCFARLREIERAGRPWRTQDLDTPLARYIAELPDSELLPALPQTGWEETARMAAVLCEDPPTFIRSLAERNLSLAAEIAAQQDLNSRLPDVVLAELRTELVARSRNSGADLRDRIACGHALGELGDPRFEPCDGPYGAYLKPPLIEVPAGTYPIGDDESITWTIVGVEGETRAHVPGHHIEFPEFAIGRFPVTNAEWTCFIESGGYEDERWWKTKAGKDWRMGVGTTKGLHDDLRYWRNKFLAQPTLVRDLVDQGTFNEGIHERWMTRLEMNEDEFNAHIKELYPEVRRTEPRFWAEAECNRRPSPWLESCWYEACAYAHWLSAQTGLTLRLPTEIEWEAATRGPEGLRFSYGNEFEVLSSNTSEARFREATPVGVFVEGDSHSGACDLTGNVWEWTSSAFGLEDAFSHNEPSFQYPYEEDDGREEPEADMEMCRVLRGRVLE